jgi:hypothetical protein
VTGAIATVPRAATARPAAIALSRLLPWLSGATVLAVGASAVDGQPVGALRDDAMYVLLAKSIATGHGYRWLNLPGTPAAIHFPPGYPAFLAMLWWFAPAFPASVVAFKLANTLLAALSAVGVARVARARFAMSEWAAQSVALAALLPIPMLSLETQVLSEPLFLALLVATLFHAERAIAHIRSHGPATSDHRPPIDHQPRSLKHAIVLGVLAGATTLVRTNGVALVGAIVILYCARRRPREGATFVASVVVLLLPWQLWSVVHANTLPAPMRGNYESYLALVGDAVRTQGIGFLGAVAMRTSHDIALILQYTVAPVAAAPIRIAALVALGALAVAGAPALWRRTPVTALFLALYSVIMLLWPYTPGRFVWCVWPLLLLLPILGALRVAAWSPQLPRLRLTRAAALAASLALAIGFTAYNVRGYRGGAWTSSAYATRLQPLLVQVVAHTPPRAVLATESEGTVYLYTGRTTVPLGSYSANDYLQPRTAAQSAAGIATVIGFYHPQAVVVSTRFLRVAASELVTRQPPLLAVADSFPGGGLVLVPVQR